MDKKVNKCLQWALLIIGIIFIAIGYIIPIFDVVVFKSESSLLVTLLSWGSAGISFVALIFAFLTASASKKESDKSNELLTQISDLQKDTSFAVKELKNITETLAWNQRELLSQAFVAPTKKSVKNRDQWTSDSTK